MMRERKRQTGQGMTEYIIIVALIAIAAIAAFSFFGKTVRDQSAGMAQELAGQENTGSKAAAKAAGKAMEKADEDKGLANFGNDVGGSE